MDIRVEKGNLQYLNDCEEALVYSELGVKYFSSEGSARGALKKGFQREEIYLAFDQKQKCIGFIWIILDGAFHSFPYLHIIAVKKEMRGLGIGRQLLEFFEELCFPKSSKLFLVVADFNPKAQKLYEEVGYQQMGILPDLYREGITEHLMMKVRKQ